MQRTYILLALLSSFMTFQACAQNPPAPVSAPNGKATAENSSVGFYFGQKKGTALPTPVTSHLESLRNCFFTAHVQAEPLLIRWEKPRFKVEKGTPANLQPAFSCLENYANEQKLPPFWLWTIKEDVPAAVGKNFAMIPWAPAMIREKTK